MKANHNWAYSVDGGAQGVVNISYSKNESKSQHTHNDHPFDGGVVNISYSKIESKSQQGDVQAGTGDGCCKYQLFKEWKQITTPFL